MPRGGLRRGRWRDNGGRGLGSATEDDEERPGKAPDADRGGEGDAPREGELSSNCHLILRSSGSAFRSLEFSPAN